MIENVRRQTALDIRELSPEPELTDLFLLATDIHNLKLLIKARLLEQEDVEFLEGGLYEREQLKTAVAEQDYRLLPRQLAEALNALEDRLKVEVQPQRVSVALDQAYLAYALATAKKCKDAFAIDYFRALCDFDNLITFLRLRAMGGAREDLRSVLLRKAAFATMRCIRRMSCRTSRCSACCRTARRAARWRTDWPSCRRRAISARSSGGGRTICSRWSARTSTTLNRSTGSSAICWRGDREAKAVRLIVTVKRNGLDDAVIQERLCELYG